MIQIDGKKYKVIENLGYQAGHYAKVVATDDGEKTAVKTTGGEWRFWESKDKLRSGGTYSGQAGGGA